MARTRLQAKTIARAYAHALRSTNHVDGAVLFGSHARGEAQPESDIDLIVLSRDFQNMPLMQRLQLLNRLRRGAALETSMDIIGLTQREFRGLERSDSPNLRRIYQEGKKIYP